MYLWRSDRKCPVNFAYNSVDHNLTKTRIKRHYMSTNYTGNLICKADT
jgi:hypothetical protein